MKFSALQISAMLNGIVEGDNEVTVSGLSKIEEGTPGTLTFLANPKYASFIYSTGASIAIVSKNFVAENDLPKTLTLIRVDDAYASFAKLLDAYNQMRKPVAEIHPSAYVDTTARVG